MSLEKVSGTVPIAEAISFFGIVTEQALSRLHADLAFLSVPAVAGLRAFHMDEAVTRAKRAMMDAAERRCLLIGHTRFGKTALHALAGLDEFDSILTDGPPDPTARGALDAAGLPLTIAGA